MEKNKIPNASFEIISERKIGELEADVSVFKHKKTGAKCIFIRNDDDNRVFYIAFKTPPSDHTGVFHILEHSVLCGSKKYPSKEPFLELAKGSLNTFLNAMTYPDKTVYPVASKNMTDFKNLVDVYLDAVFNPAIYSKKEIFHQEGWHYHLSKLTDELHIQGIVYNEMKGAYSSPERVLFDAVMQALFPQTSYRFEAGGKPDEIRKLSYQQFLNDHARYYHPSNAYIYLYGDLSFDEWLEYLDKNYLVHYEFSEVDSAIVPQKPLEKVAKIQTYYSVNPQDEIDQRTYLSLNFVVGNATDPLQYMALDILEHILLETPASPLKKALLDADIAQEISGYVDLNLLQPLMGVIAKNTNPEMQEKFKNTIFDTLRELSQHGIDQKLIQGSINIHEFQLREADYHGFPKGLFYGLNVMDSWLYGGDPVAHLAYQATLDQIKKLSKVRYFESMISTLLLNNPHYAEVIAVPSRGMEEVYENTMRKDLAVLKQNADTQTLHNWHNETQQLVKMQETPDSEESLMSIPLLKLDDIEKKSEILPILKEKMGQIEFLMHPMSTSNIIYLNLYFDISQISNEELPYLNLLTYMLGKISTKNYSTEDLSNEILLSTGGISFDEMTINDYHDIEIFHRILNVQAKALNSQVPRMVELMNEMMFHSQLTDPKRIRELLLEMRSSYESNIYQNGHLIAAKRLNSYFSPSGYWLEKLSGLSFYHFLLDHEAQWSTDPDSLINALQKTYQKVFATSRLIFSATCPNEDLKLHLPLFEKWMKDVPILPTPSFPTMEFSENILNEGILSSSKVQYVMKGYNYKRMGLPYKGSLQVLDTISSLDYLWNRIRVMGGAYGAFIRLSRTGRIILGSYRDPELEKTLQAYDQMGEYLKGLQLSERELRKYIIGTMSQMDAPLTPSMKGQKSDIQYISCVQTEDIQKERDEILSTQIKDINELSEWIQVCISKNCHCVLGNERKLNENRKLFGSLIKAFR